MEFLNNPISKSGLNSALERIGEIDKLSRFVDGIGNKFSTVLDKISQTHFKQELGPVITDVAKEHNVDPKIITAMIEQESGFNPHVISNAGALGLMQLMPGTAQEMGVKDPLNPIENIRAGTKYFSSLLNRYQGNVILALSAYNAGPNNVDRFKGVPPFKETRNYVEQIMNKLT